ncbi:MAG: DUF4386 family protein [Acidaminobacter sp.]|uniref:DUF4386 domain-containing protein n=1 Tax=Acidaminobacter sp. TaxID=1872102 RepID=UPI00137E0E5A|nr:DUF4386 domain-containing protein [Acidaminobacter sp.]MZQ99701.1 DUF4386 family protein [Acidaminobacter sp.]
MGTNKKTARLAGLIWLLMFIFGPMAQVVRSKLFIPGDSVTTAQNLLTNEFLFRLGFVSDLLMMVLFLLLPLVLYKLFCHVDKNLSLLMVIFVIVSVPINMLNLLNEFAALHLLRGAEYLNAVATEQLMANAMFTYDLYLNGYEIANVFFALWLVPLGLLVYKSGFLPKFLGTLLVVGGLSLFLEVLLYFLLPGYETVNTILLIPQTISEFAFLLWILIRGINETKVGAANLSENLVG